MKRVKAGAKGKARRSNCPISYALDILGDRWTLLVLRDAVFQGKQTFGEFLDSPERIATNILADRLRRLECKGILERQEDSAMRSRVLYRLTDKGIGLVPVLLDLVVWGAKHDMQTAAPKAFVRRAVKDREALIEETVAKLRRPPVRMAFRRLAPLTSARIGSR